MHSAWFHSAVVYLDACSAPLRSCGPGKAATYCPPMYREQHNAWEPPANCHQWTPGMYLFWQGARTRETCITASDATTDHPRGLRRCGTLPEWCSPVRQDIVAYYILNMYNIQNKFGMHHSWSGDWRLPYKEHYCNWHWIPVFYHRRVCLARSQSSPQRATSNRLCGVRAKKGWGHQRVTRFGMYRTSGCGKMRSTHVRDQAGEDRPSSRPVVPRIFESQIFWCCFWAIQVFPKTSNFLFWK